MEIGDAMLPRFNYLAKDIPEALVYYQNRATQLLYSGWSWDGSYIDLGWGIQVSLFHNNIGFDSVYVLKKGQGHLTKWFQEQNRNFMTMAGCESMYNWLRLKQLPYTLAQPFESSSYRKISVFYGDRRAERSNVFYMNHIDEGLYILNKLTKNKSILDAYCLHPIYQADQDLKIQFSKSNEYDISMLTLLALEYRNIANAYLPKRILSSINDIVLSPLEEVNIMLRADKIQNRKDFEQYHLNTHPRSERLIRYFQDWFEKLEISEDFYQECVKEINEKTGTKWK